MVAEELSFEGKKYILSRAAAKRTKYSNDYIGELCRSGKIEARQIGRVWYVEEQSLLAHKGENGKQGFGAKKIKRARENSTDLPEPPATYIPADTPTFLPPLSKTVPAGFERAFATPVSSPQTQTEKMKPLISSKVARKLTGYSNDYIGELCRTGKIIAVQKGRFWHIDKESLLAHKNEFGKQGFGAAKVAELRAAAAPRLPLLPHIRSPYVLTALKLSAFALFALTTVAGFEAFMEVRDSVAGRVRGGEQAALSLSSVGDVARLALRKTGDRLSDLLFGKFEYSLVVTAPAKDDTGVLIDELRSLRKELALLKTNGIAVSPVIERTIVERSAVGPGAVTRADLDILQSALKSEIYRVSAVAASDNSATYHAVALTNRIDQLYGTDISGATITDSTFSGSVVASTLSATSFSATSANLGTTSVSALAVTNTSTSTFAGPIDSSAGTSTLQGLVLESLNCSAFGNSGKLTADASGNVICADDANSGGGGGSSFGKTFELLSDGVTLSPTTTAKGLLINAASSTITNLVSINSTSTNATTTSFFSTTASSTNLFATTLSVGGASLGNTSVDGTLNVGGLATLSGGVLVNAASSTITNLAVVNGTTTNATSTNLFSTNSVFTNATTTNLAVTGIASTSVLTVSNNASVGGTVTVMGATTLSSTLTASGLATLSGGVLVNAASSTITNLVSINSTSTNATTTNLAVSGSASTSALTVSNGASVGGTLNVAGAATFSSTFSAGTTTLTNLIVTNLSTSTFAGPLSSASGNLILASAGISNNLLLNPYGGNVGIGTTSPSSKLSIFGDLFLEGSSRYFNFGTATGTSGYGFRDNAGTLEFKNSGGTWQGVTTATSGPSFLVHKNGTAQTFAQNTWTKLTWSTETFDTNNNFASDRFTPTVSGKYFITGGLQCADAGTGICGVSIYKNGSPVSYNYFSPSGGSPAIRASTMVEMNGITDYLEIYGHNGSGVNGVTGDSAHTNFSGALIAPVSATAGGWTNDNIQSYLIDSTDLVAVGTSTAYAKQTIWGAATGKVFEVVSSASTTLLSVSATGFGTTTLSGLTISGSATSTSNVGFNLSAGCYAVNGTCIGTGNATPAGSTGSVQFNNGGSLAGNNSIFIDVASGRVGFSTTTPYAVLTVASSTRPQLLLSDPTAATNQKHFYASSTQGRLGFGTLSDDLTTLSEKMTITSTGNVGIGTTTPNWSLQVASATPYIALTDTDAEANLKQWLISAVNGIFRIGTSSDSLSSTSTLFSIDNASTTLARALAVTATATSSFTGGLQTAALNVTSATASSTFANGINVTSGCLAQNGTCVNNAAVTLTAVRTYTTGTNVAYTPPSNAAYIVVETIGGGGGGGSNSTATAGATGGGGGGFSQKMIAAPSGTYYYTIGTGGSAGASGNVGSGGGTSCFGTNSTACNSPTIAATGGGGGNGTNPIAGGAGSGGDINITGGPSGVPAVNGTLINGGNGGNGARGGGGGTGYFNVNSEPGTAPGGGGGGGGYSGGVLLGGAGASGSVTIYEYTSAVTNPNSGTQLTAVRTYTSNSTWAKPSNIAFVIVETVGGGGGGGGGDTDNPSRGTGGGGGGYSREFINAAALGSTETVTVGGGGPEGTSQAVPTNGNTGGTSSFGSHLSAAGGTGGSAASGASQGGAGGGSASGGDVNLQGQSSGVTTGGADSTAVSGGGNAGGGMGAGGNANVEEPGRLYGGGGSACNHSGSNCDGGTSGGGAYGAAGVVIVYEYTTQSVQSGSIQSGTAGQLVYYAAAGANLTATSSIFLATSGAVGIGTSTPQWNLQVAGTRPSFALSDSSAAANLKHWLFSSMGGNLYIGTSTDAYATSTTPALAISNAGNLAIAGLGTTTVAGFLDVNGTGTNATSTFASNLWVKGGLQVGASSLYLDTDSIERLGGSLLLQPTSGNVGIGTTTPWGLLSVNPNGITGPAFVIGSSTATKLIVTNGGNVGIGTTNPVDRFTVHIDTGTISLARFEKTQTTNDLGAYMTFTGGTTGGTARGYLGFAKSGTGDPTIFTDETANAMALRSEGALQFGTGGDNVRLTITSGGNVGIGTTSPYAKLSVVGETVAPLFTATTTGFRGPDGSASTPSFSFSNDTNTGIFLNAGDTVGVSAGGTAVVFFNVNPQIAAGSAGSASSPIYSFQSDPDTGIFNPSNANILAFSVGGSERFRVDSTGNVGIGTTSPYAKLSVVGETVAPLFTATTTGFRGPDGSASVPAYSFSNDTTSGITRALPGDGNNSVSVVHGGSSRLDVNSIVVKANVPFQNLGSSISSPAFGGNSLSSGFYFVSGLSDIRFFVGSVDRMTISSNIGIGTTSPYAKLSVVGETVAAYFTATTTSNSTFPNLVSTNSTTTNATTTNLAVSGTASTTNLVISSAGTGATKCLQVNGSGLVAAATSACGSGSSGQTFELLADGVTLSPTTTAKGLLINAATSTITNLTMVNSTSTNATTTTLAVSGLSQLTTLAVSGASVLSSTLSAGTTTSTNLVVTNTSTSTFTGGVQTSALNVTSTSASSTFANGINLTGGCVAENGTCIRGTAVTLTAVRTYTSGTNVAYTPPSNAAYIVVETIGGGGGGGGGNSTNTAGGGGGGGGYAQKLVRGPSGTYYYTIGAGGVGVTGDTDGGPGGNSCFGTNTTACTTPLAQGSGGTGGTRGAFGGAGGSGGAAPTGDITLRGSAGAGGTASAAYPFATGGMAPRAGGGGDNGGNVGYGGGGSGSKDNGFAGSAGIIIISEYTSAVTNSAIGTSLTAVRNYTSGTNASYIPPSNVAYLIVETWGAGGGGGSTSAGGAGGQTCFGTNSTACTTPLMTANGGSAGTGGTTNSSGAGAAGGTASGGDINITGGSGSGGVGYAAGSAGNYDGSGGAGGAGARGGLGGGAGSISGNVNINGTAPGGAGAGIYNGGTNGGGGGGGGGGYSQKLIASPASTYYYTIGAAGAAAGGAGAVGGVTIYEYTYSGLNVGSNNTGTIGQLAYYAAAGNTLTATSSIFLSTSGAVGIGTSTPLARLFVLTTNSKTTASDLGGITIGANDTSNQLQLITSLVGGASSAVRYGSIQVTEQGSATNNLVLNAAGGNVGIGTTTPPTILTAAWTGAFTGPRFVKTDGGPAYMRLQTVNTADDVGIEFGDYASPRKWIVGKANRTSKDFWILEDGLTERVTVQAGGNVGIGTTSPTSKLAVTGPIEFSGTSVNAVNPNSGILSYESGLGSTRFIAIGPDTSTSGTLDLVVANLAGGGQSTVRINSSGKVGIGTTSPVSELHVRQTSDSDATNGISVTNTSGASTGKIIQGGDNNTYIINQSTNSILLGTGNSSLGTFGVRMNVQHNGNVSITGNCSDAAGGGGCTADYAEVYRKDAESPMEKGDILAISTSTGKTVRADASNSLLLGVFTTAPGSLIGQRANSIQLGVGKGVMDDLEADEVPVSLSGRVPVKVTNENGPIRVGDRITLSSLPGVGMRAGTSGAMTVGFAMESFNPADSGNDVTVYSATSTPVEVNVNGTTYHQKQITVFVDLKGAVLDTNAFAAAQSASTLSSTSTPWMVDNNGGLVSVNFNADINLLGHKILDVSRISGYMGKWSIDENGKFIGDEIAVKKATVESGVTTRDKVTGEYQCMYVAGGALMSASGACPDYTGAPASPASGTASSENATTTPPADTATITPPAETTTATESATTTPTATNTGGGETATSSPANISEGNVGGQAPPAETTAPSDTATSTEPTP